jgi:hypothetical protein
MRTGISITVMASDRKRLQALVKNRNAVQKHAWRAEIVLPSADGVPLMRGVLPQPWPGSALGGDEQRAAADQDDAMAA